MKNIHQKIDTLLFDLGGVLVELGGQPIRNEWMDGVDSIAENWRKWLTSRAARSFETGKISPTEFANAIVEEMKLNISAEQFIKHFRKWPTGTFPGVLETLDSLKHSYQLAIFSNSNVLHWPIKMKEMQLEGKFHHYFASHQMGMAKPDPAAFEYVADELGGKPECILFMDDNQLNIDTASKLGFNAELVNGINGVNSCLTSYGIAPNSLNHRTTKF